MGKKKEKHLFRVSGNANMGGGSYFLIEDYESKDERHIRATSPSQARIIFEKKFSKKWDARAYLGKAAITEVGEVGEEK